MADKELYGQLRDILVTLNAVNSTFTPFSARDINEVITAKLNSKTKKYSKYLEQLYKLEAMIHALRESFDKAKSNPTA